MLFEKSDEDGETGGKNKKTTQNKNTTHFLFDEKGPIKPKFYENNMMIGLGVGNFETIGYKARHTNKIIDLNNIGYYDWEDFFEPIYLAEHIPEGNKKVVLEQGRFYILPTKEKIRVPNEYSMELIPFTHLMGELRVHYA